MRKTKEVKIIKKRAQREYHIGNKQEAYKLWREATKLHLSIKQQKIDKRARKKERLARNASRTVRSSS